jgi:hypothetical protein
MKSNETFGSGVSQKVVDVIEQREKLHKNPKTPREHSLINSNTAWVKLRSSINEISEAEANEVVQDKEGLKRLPPGTSEKAELFVLMGGTQNAFAGGSNPGIRSGVELGTDFNATKAYNWDRGEHGPANKLGFRPMAGITNFKVASKNTYGTLQQAEVDFVVWTLDDLERAELLFFRPGYTALLEWGHSVFIDGKGVCNIADNTNFTIEDEPFFNGSTPKKIDELIAAKRKELSFNYDGMFGFVTNFNWSYRSDGGYDCSVRIISRGAVLDSIKTGNQEDHIEQTEEEIEETKKERKSIWHSGFTALEKKNGPEIEGREAWNFWQPRGLGDLLERDFKAFGFTLDIADGKYAYWLNEDAIDLRYIPLYTVLDIFNTFVALKDPKTKGEFSKFLIFNENTYLTFPEHFSLDPLVAVKPEIPSGETSKFFIEKKDLHSKMASFASSQGGADKIGNIMVSTHFVRAQLDSVIDSADQDGIGVLDVIRGILQGINTAFGDVNELDISTLEDGATHVIVDRKNPDPKNIPTFQLTGLSSTIVDINLSSKISSQIAAQISIAAQGSSGNYTDNVSTILKWNMGAVDRHMPVKSPKKDETDTSEQEKRFESFIEDLTEVYEDFNEWDADYLSDTWQAMKVPATAYIKRLYRENLKEKKGKVIIPGVIPVELTIKMLGITGFKVGLSFKIPKGILPKKYDEYGYIITGLENEIGSDNKWYTTLKTQFYSV